MTGRPPRSPAASVAALVGHELGTPIATALLYLGIAECHSAGLKPNGLLRAALAVAKAEILQLKKILDRVTQLEQRGVAQLSPRVIDLGATVRTAVERTLLAGPRRGDVTVQARGEVFGWWDDVAVEQIVSNLLSNALKFGQQRGVRVTVEPAPGAARIVVSDAGPGIRPGTRERMFERGRRAAPHRGGGLGLGLWIVRELVRAHRGRVTVQSRIGHGSTITVHLPELVSKGTTAIKVQPPTGFDLPDRQAVNAGALASAPATSRPHLVLLPSPTSRAPAKRAPRRRGDLAHHA